MNSVAYISKIHMRAIRDIDGEVRVRPYTNPEVDQWAEEALKVASTRWLEDGDDMPPLLMFLFPPRNDERRTIQGMINMGPLLRTGRISEVTEALPKTLRELRAFAMLRIEWVRGSDRSMRATFETFQRAWTQTYRLSRNEPHLELLRIEDGSRHKDRRFEGWLRNEVN